MNYNRSRDRDTGEPVRRRPSEAGARIASSVERERSRRAWRTSNTGYDGGARDVTAVDVRRDGVCTPWAARPPSTGIRWTGGADGRRPSSGGASALVTPTTAVRLAAILSLSNGLRAGEWRARPIKNPANANLTWFWTFLIVKLNTIFSASQLNSKKFK